MNDLLDLPVLELVDDATLANPNGAAIAAAVDVLRHCPQVEMPVTHRWAPGIYIREIFMPAGTLVVGYVHKTKHFNVVLTGRALVHWEGRTEEIVAPCTFVSEAGAQKVLHIIEDCRWMTIHDNPSESTDVLALEEALVEVPEDWLAAKGGMTLDQFRHAVPTLPRGDSNVCIT